MSQESPKNEIISNKIGPESEPIPPWLEEVVKTAIEAWFDPKSFEKNPGFYEKLGVKKFKKWMPTTGDVMYRLLFNKDGTHNLVKPTLESLKSYEATSRLLEGIHLIAFAIMASTLAIELQFSSAEVIVANTGANVLINIYPILVQRYNRVRLYGAINRMQRKESVASAKPTPKSDTAEI